MVSCVNCQETMKYTSFKNGKWIDVGKKKKVFASGIYCCEDCNSFVWIPVEKHEGIKK